MVFHVCGVALVIVAHRAVRRDPRQAVGHGQGFERRLFGILIRGLLHQGGKHIQFLPELAFQLFTGAVGNTLLPTTGLSPAL